MVLTGQVTRRLVDQINEHGPLATGIAGRGALACSSVERVIGDRRQARRPRPRRRRHRGRPAARCSISSRRAASRWSPRSLAPARSRMTRRASLNVNADSAAAALAVALGAAKLVVLTDVAGLYRDWPNRDSLVSHHQHRRAPRTAAEPRVGHDPQDDGVPRRRRGRRREGRDHRRACPALDPPRDLHARESEPRWCPHELARRLHDAPHDEHLRTPHGDARARRGLHCLGMPTASATSTSSPASP